MAADAKATFAVKLNDETSGSADAAAGALTRLHDGIKRDQKALSAMESAMRSMQKASVVNIEAFRQLSSQIAAKRNAIAAATADYVALGGAFGQARPKASNLAAGFQQLADAAKEAAKAAKDSAAAQAQWAKVAQKQQIFADPRRPMKFAEATKKAGVAAKGSSVQFNDLNDALEGGGAQIPQFARGLIQGTAALGPFGIALSAVVASLVGLAVGAGGMFALLRFAMQSREALEGVSQEAINVAKRSPIARAEISKLADELAKTGLSGAALERAIEKELPKRFGKEATKSMQGFSVQLAKAKENAQLLFLGLNFDKFHRGLGQVLGLLDESTASGQALKSVLESVLQPIIDGAAAALPKVRAFFLGMATGALRAATQVLLVGVAIKKAAGVKFGGSELAIDFQKVGVAAGVAAVSIGLLAVGIGAIVAIVFGATAAVLALGAAIGFGIATGVGIAITTGQALWNWLQNTHALFGQAIGELKQAGRSMMTGLADGIRDGASSVITAATNAAKSAVKAAKDALGIASPSKVFAGLGEQTSAGMAVGIKQGAPDVQSAAETMISAPTEAAPPKGGAIQTAARAVEVTIQQVLVQGVDGAEDPAFVEKLAQAFGDVLPMLGGSLEGSTP